MKDNTTIKYLDLSGIKLLTSNLSAFMKKNSIVGLLLLSMITRHYTTILQMATLLEYHLYKRHLSEN